MFKSIKRKFSKLRRLVKKPWIKAKQYFIDFCWKFKYDVMCGWVGQNLSEYITLSLRSAELWLIINTVQVSIGSENVFITWSIITIS